MLVIAFLIQGIIVFFLYTKAVEKAIDRVYIARDFSLDRVEDKRAMASGQYRAAKWRGGCGYQCPAGVGHRARKWSDYLDRR